MRPGLNSEASVKVTGTSPPRPKFERNRKTPSATTFQDVATPGKDRKQANRRLKRRAAADIVGERAPEQRAQECADQADSRKEPGLRGAEAEFAGDRRKRRAEQRKIHRVKRNAAERKNEEIPVPIRKWQPLEPRDKLCGLRLIILSSHASPRPEIFNVRSERIEGCYIPLCLTRCVRHCGRRWHSRQRTRDIATSSGSMLDYRRKFCSSYAERRRGGRL
jgi:hypothetical protein